MPTIDQVIIGVAIAAVVFVAVRWANRRQKTRPEALAATDPIAELAAIQDREISRRRVQAWYNTAVETMAERDSRDVAAGYAGPANHPNQ
jgi:hypothetical protein